MTVDSTFDAMSNVLPITFRYLASGMTNRAVGLHSISEERRFRALFGITLEHCYVLWRKIQGTLPEGSQPTHLLWALLLLKTYATEDVLCTIIQVDAKTFRKWSWIIISSISNIKEVSYSVDQC